MPGLKFYYDSMSQPCRAVLIFLKLNKIPYEDKPVALMQGEHLASEFAAINPIRRVPVIDDDGFILTESIAILKYLAVKYHVPDHWHPKDLQKLARVDEYLHWYHINTRINAALVFRTQAFDPFVSGKPINVEKLNKNRKDFDAMLTLMETVFLRDNQFLCGNEISIADLMAICELMQPIVCGEDIYKGHPKLAAWHERVKTKLQPEFDDAHEAIYRFGDRFTKNKSKI